MPLNINNLTAGTPVTFNAQTSVQRMVFDSATVAFRIVNNTTGIITVSEENSDGFICQVDPGDTAFGLMQNAILVEAQYPGPVTLTPYTWIPVSSGASNTFTAQNIFKSPSATVAGGVFQSSGTISTIPAGYGGSNLVAQFIAEESSAFPYTLYESTGNAQGHVLAFRTSRGTYASRTAVQSGDLLGQLDFGGHNSSSLVNGKASIQAQAAQTWTSTANGTQLLFNVTANGTAAPTLQFILTATTATFTNDVVAPYFQVNRPAGSSKPILYRSSGSTRWTMQATAGAESGGNVGADWALDAHTDAGAYNFTALSISRSGGNATFYNLVNAPQLRISLSNPPASATATGSAGAIRWDANYIYVCTATDTWKRVAIATWP